MPSRPPDARGALLGRLIDHAALFPPASLDMPAALEEDRRARATPHAWMLDRFVVPASRLGELPPDPPALSVVLDAEADLSGLPVRVVEGKALPAPPEGVEGYWEIDPGGDLRAALATAREAGVGAKIRCGNEVFPQVEAVAAFVAACRDAGVRFKATAGLHHAVRRPPMHGFLNLLAASVFAHADGLREEELAPLLAEEDPAAFTVDPDGIELHGRRAGAEAIAAARAGLFTAYGSCSFFEPVADLQALGVLPPGPEPGRQ